MATKQHAGAYLLVVAGIIAVAVVAVVFSGWTASILSGIALLVLAALRCVSPQARAISSRSRAFDALLLAGLGAVVLILALTADNI